MPHLAALGLDLDPSRSPLDYPGRVVRADSLLAGAWLHPLDGPEVVADGGALGTRRIGLDDALARLGRAPLAQRRPVLAIGSNASPGQLRHKFGDPVVPLTAVVVDGLAVGHSAHVSRAGYVPWAPLARPGHRLAALLLWLDAEQVPVLDRTEPNYRRVPLPAAMRVGGGRADRLTGPELYRSRWGLLRPRPGAPPLAATTQADVWAALLGRAGIAGAAGTADPGTAARRTAATPALRDRVRLLLAEQGCAGPDGLDDGPVRTVPGPPG